MQDDIVASTPGYAIARGAGWGPRQVGEIVVRTLASVAVCYLVAFFEMGFGLGVYVQLHNGIGFRPLEILGYSIAAASILGLILLATLPLRNVARQLQVAVLAFSVLMVALISRTFWNVEHNQDALFVLAMAASAACGAYAAWRILNMAIRSLWKAAAIGTVLFAGGLGLNYLVSYLRFG